MAEKNSYSCSDIEEIHNELMRVLINGHVGFNEDSETHTNWKMKFKTYCDDTTERKGCVRGNIEYLEKKKNNWSWQLWRSEKNICRRRKSVM